VTFLSNVVRIVAACYFSKFVSANFEEAAERTTAALRREGFGIITEVEVDVQQTLKKKINVDVRPYRILGAC